jgi:hypothetical protein
MVDMQDILLIKIDHHMAVRTMPLVDRRANADEQQPLAPRHLSGKSVAVMELTMLHASLTMGSSSRKENGIPHSVPSPRREIIADGLGRVMRDGLVM